MLNPWVWVGALLTAAALVAGGVGVGKRLERQVWQAEKIKLQNDYVVTLEKTFEDRRRAELFNQANARKATENLEKALETLRAGYAVDIAAVRAAGGLRIPRATCPAARAPQSPGASGPHEEAAATEKLPDRIEERLFALALRADEQAEQLRALQDWVRDNGFYGPEPQ